MQLEERRTERPVTATEEDESEGDRRDVSDRVAHAEVTDA